MVTLFKSIGPPLRSDPRPPLRGVPEGVRAPLPDGDEGRLARPTIEIRHSLRELTEMKNEKKRQLPLMEVF